MPDCTIALDCCPRDNSFDYEIAGSALLNVVTSSSPLEGGLTSGDGQYALGAIVTVVATPQVPTTIDVGVDLVFIADETSTGPEIRVLLNNTMAGLEAALIAAGIGSGAVANQYGLVGFGSIGVGTHGGVDNVAHSHYALGNLAGFIAAIDDIAKNPNSGPVEDTYEAISFAVSNSAWRVNAGVARVIVSLSDEDRNTHLYTTGGVTQAQQFAAILAELVAAEIHYIGIGSWCGIEDGLGNQIMGFSRTPDKTWRADGSGGYTNGTGGNATLDGDTDATYPTGVRDETMELALHESLDGSFWDFEVFRVGIGTCTTNGTAVTRASGDVWAVAGAVDGGDISINGVDYVIDTIIDDTALTLTTSAGVQSIVDWTVPRAERESFVEALVQSMDEAISTLVAWEFDGWYDSGGGLKSNNTSYTFTLLNNIALEARFSYED